MHTLPLSFLWLEITGRCNLHCRHCYASSSPQGNHGVMQCADWEYVIAQASDLGCRRLQFIGGEPTIYPYLAHLLSFAFHRHMQIEVYSNLVSVRPALWEVFLGCRVSLATSFYSAIPAVHEEITGGHGNFLKTVGNIKQAIALGLPLRAGLIEMAGQEQNIEETKRFLRDLGVQRIGVDHARSVGRGSVLVQVGKPEDALCGKCAKGRAAIVPDGSVYPCVFSRWLPAGNVLEQSLQSIVAGSAMTSTRTRLTAAFAQRRGQAVSCDPECEPHECDPNCEPGACAPDVACDPSSLCLPDFKPPCSPEEPCSPDTCNPDACPPDRLD